MVENGDLLLQELLHWIAEANPTAEKLVIEVLYLVENGGTTALCQLSKQLSCNFMPSRPHKDFLEVVANAEV